MLIHYGPPRSFDIWISPKNVAFIPKFSMHDSDITLQLNSALSDDIHKQVNDMYK